MGTSHASNAGGKPATKISVEEIAKLISDADGDWPFSIDDQGQVELFIDNGIYTLSQEEFVQLQKAVPTVDWKEYPNNWAPDEIDEVVSYLIDRDLVDGLRTDHDADGALQTLKIYLGADPRDAGEGFPEWVRRLDGPDVDVLARGVLKVLGIAAPETPKHESQTPEALVDKMLAEDGLTG
jgi:hypothetical protein